MWDQVQTTSFHGLISAEPTNMFIIKSTRDNNIIILFSEFPLRNWNTRVDIFNVWCWRALSIAMNAILIKRSLHAPCFQSAVLPSVVNTHLLDHWAMSARIRSSARGYGSWISKGARSCSLEASSGRSQSSLVSSGAGLGAGWVALGLASVLSMSPPGLCEELQSSSGESR
jgi:hypothetical protein